MIFCTACGKENEDAARSCSSCGARFRGQAEGVPFTQMRQDEREPPLHHVEARDEMERVPAQPLMIAGERRDPVLVLVLGFLTCYVYLFYWWYVTGQEIKRATRRAEINPPLELVLNILTCSLFSIYLSYKYPKLILEMQERVGVARNDTSLASLLLSLFSLGPIACYVIQTDLNRIWEAKNRAESRSA
jgi:hypothetical protein